MNDHRQSKSDLPLTFSGSVFFIAGDSSYSLLSWIHLAQGTESKEKDLILPSSFSLKGIAFFFLFSFLSSFFFFFLLGVQTVLKGIVCPLAVKTHPKLDLAHRKECVTLWCSSIQFSPLCIGALYYLSVYTVYTIMLTKSGLYGVEWH